MIYVLLTTFMFAINFNFQSRSPKSNIQMYYFVLFAIFLFSALRYEVGCDWISYGMFLKNMEKFTWLQNMSRRDPLFWLMFDSVNQLNLAYPFVNIFSSIIFFIGIHSLARRQPNPLAFLVVLFPILIINMPMSAIRQGAAIGIICIAIVAIIDKRPIHFLLWVLLASGFHASAMAFMALLPFASGNYNKKRFTMAAILVFMVIILLYYTGSAKQAHTSYILEVVNEAHGAIFRVGMLTVTALFFLLVLRKKWQQTFPQDYNIVNLGALGMILLIFIVPVTTVISDRYGYYLIPFQAMIFARLPYLRFKDKAIHELYCVLPYLGLFITFIIWTQISYHFNACYIPYDSWIFGLPSTIE